ncbi:DUF3223 domain-containing protein [Pedobacter changchengzhani]|uniref:DUF3223 domain-containing protein n=1 Tax=Pedobacter changchengzhani TaxID=2529274 RepID=A0A4R5MNZ3_9SPHI|nr:DUF3223 domain-containing protein [Pedobacter changchengzhani]TDG36849.1 DUF3223 domain-containing protein [Pedobacter changchengzhani]
MRKPLKIGQKEYKFKKDAITHYRKILNSYEFNQSLNTTDFKDLMSLLDYDYVCYVIENEDELIDETEDEDIDELREFLYSNTPSNELIILDIKIAKVQFNTKCFELFYKDGSSEYISYLMIINNAKYTPEKQFNVACRNAIHKDIRKVKQKFFDDNSIKGQVKCQETGLMSKWIELTVDHRQPNTFSIIVDRFKEVNAIDLVLIEYTSNDQNHIIFKDENLTEKFRKYHMDKASLRIVRTECNSSRTGLARLKRTSKDLTIQ